MAYFTIKPSELTNDARFELLNEITEKYFQPDSESFYQQLCNVHSKDFWTLPEGFEFTYSEAQRAYMETFYAERVGGDYSYFTEIAAYAVAFWQSSKSGREHNQFPYGPTSKLIDGYMALLRWHFEPLQVLWALESSPAFANCTGAQAGYAAKIAINDAPMTYDNGNFDSHTTFPAFAFAWMRHHLAFYAAKYEEINEENLEEDTADTSDGNSAPSPAAI